MNVLWTPPKAPPDPNIRTAYLSDVHAEDDSGKVLCQRFKLLAPIGFGATAAVYRAIDLETKSDVAVKILYKNLRDDAEALRYFAQEGRLAARIIHPHLLRAHFFGQRRRAPFIVFELVPGTSLTQIAALRPIPWRRLAAIVLQVLDALAKLHEEGVIHGDIQPENVIVQQTTLGHDFAKVIDLGFASARGCSRLTQAAEPPAEVHGTASFIAPERLAGLEPDGRADLYSVGALMYFLLTTRPVPDISLAPDELGVPTPGIMAPGAGIPVVIDAIVMRALSDIDDRFQSAAEMAEALRGALAQPDQLVPEPQRHPREPAQPLAQCLLEQRLIEEVQRRVPGPELELPDVDLRELAAAHAGVFDALAGHHIGAQRLDQADLLVDPQRLVVAGERPRLAVRPRLALEHDAAQAVHSQEVRGHGAHGAAAEDDHIGVEGHETLSVTDPGRNDRRLEATARAATDHPASIVTVPAPPSTVIR